ncbi:MAG TPA: hemolysin III family protein [Acidimicrobiia bacterium]|jgi:hemolysin III
MDRIAWGKMQHPVRGLLHGTAAVLAVVGLVLLLAQAEPTVRHWVGAAVFGCALIAMFSISSLYHSVPWSDQWKGRMQRVDHSLIFVLVAGTFTPFALIALDGWARVLALTLIWGVAVTGVVLKLSLKRVRTPLSVGLQLGMGWAAVLIVPVIWTRLGPAAVALTLLGGLAYTIGSVFYATKWPKLFPRVFSYHEIFHILVIAGAAFHYAVILRYVMPLE